MPPWSWCGLVDLSIANNLDHIDDMMILENYFDNTGCRASALHSMQEE